MCTVTIVPKGKTDFILTSNRDEAPNRISLTPNFYTVDATKVLFPMDEQSGGTWIGISQKNRVVCVLNGAFEIHERQSSYRISRGKVAKDLMSAHNITNTINDYDFKGIEPFTVVIADWNEGLKFFELIWDEAHMHFTELPLRSKIWSSSTLYNKAMRDERLRWFQDFKSEHHLNAKNIQKFHKNAGAGNLDYGVVINRGNVRTTSITQIEKHDNELEMHYENLLKKEHITTVFQLPRPVHG